MADAERRSDVIWEGNLTKGRGEVMLVSRGAAAPLPVTWASRTQRSDGKTSPEELLAAAHAACFCMALANMLTEGGTPPERLKASATVTFAQIENGFKVASSHLQVKGAVPGLDDAGFKEAAAMAKDGCPISGALKGNVELSVEAELV